MTAPNVGMTGTKTGMTGHQCKNIGAELEVLAGDWFHHGDCIGADFEAHCIAKQIGYRVAIHPPLDVRRRAWCVGQRMYPQYEFLIRNTHIVLETDCMLAAPRKMVSELRSGTWHAIRYARKLERPLAIFWPDGSVLWERWVLPRI